jgi:hypothetical protein
MDRWLIRTNHPLKRILILELCMSNSFTKAKLVHCNRYLLLDNLNLVHWIAHLYVFIHGPKVLMCHHKVGPAVKSCIYISQMTGQDRFTEVKFVFVGCFLD